MKRLSVFVCLLVLLTAVSLPLFAASANSDWLMTVASSDAADEDGKLPVRGAVFKDQNGSRFVVSKHAGDTVVFDRYWSSDSFEDGEELERTNTIVSARGFFTTLFAGVEATCVVPFIYPFQPFVMGGFTFKKLALADAGVMLTVPLSNLSNIKNTLIRNAAFEGYAGMGFYGKNLSVVAGIDYRHAVKSFNWGVGVMLMLFPSSSTTTLQMVVPRAFLGVSF